MTTQRTLAAPVLVLLLAVSGAACANDGDNASSDQPTAAVQEPVAVTDEYPDVAAEPSVGRGPVDRDDYVGAWGLTALGNGTVTYTTSELAAAGSPADSTIDLRADGTVTYTLVMASVDGSADGVWGMADDGTVTIDLGGEQTGTVTLKHGRLELALTKADGSVMYSIYDRA